MAKTNVREIFNLPDGEEIFDDFSCKEGSLTKGRLYLTTNYMCYYSNFLGKSKKIVIKWKQITNFAKDGNNAIRVTRSDMPEVIFKDFAERDTSFKFIRRLWSNVSPHA